jgi:hypothetical protein
MIAIINLLSNILITGTSIIGCATIINKVGKFCKIIEDSKEDGFKFAFDNFMMESIDDMNKCVESVTIISSNLNNVIFILYDIMVGNKYIKKNKEGKLIITNKTKLFSNYKEKIDELNNKLKEYQDEIKKIKLKKDSNKDNTKQSSCNDDDSSLSDSSLSDSSISESESSLSDSSTSDFSLNNE